MAVTYWRRLDLLYLGVFITEKVFICGTYPIAIFNGSLVTCKESFKLNLDDAMELDGADVIVLGVLPSKFSSRQADRLVMKPRQDFVKYTTRVLMDRALPVADHDLSS